MKDAKELYHDLSRAEFDSRHGEGASDNVERELATVKPLTGAQ